MLALPKRIEAGRRAAFTLIELLMVIAIISFLMIILIVVIRQPADVRPRAIIKELASELAAYYAVYGAYPPSKMPSGYPGAAGVGSGAQCLYYFLMGPSEKGWGPAPSDGGVAPVFSRPAAAIRIAWIGGDKGRRYFTDDLSGDLPILYYRANTTLMSDGRPRLAYTEIYDNTDNNAYWRPKVGPKSEWERMVRNPRSKNNAPFNAESYFLVAAGEDRKFGVIVETPGVEGKCDDITN